MYHTLEFASKGICKKVNTFLDQTFDYKNKKIYRGDFRRGECSPLLAFSVAKYDIAVFQSANMPF